MSEYPSVVVELGTKAKIIVELEEWRDWTKSVDGCDMSDTGSVPDGPDDRLIDEVKASVIITAEHAKDLIATVQFLKALHEADKVPAMPGPGIPTSAYCDELLEDLGQ